MRELLPNDDAVAQLTVLNGGIHGAREVLRLFQIEARQIEIFETLQDFSEQEFSAYLLHHLLQARVSLLGECNGEPRARFLYL